MLLRPYLVGGSGSPCPLDVARPSEIGGHDEMLDETLSTCVDPMRVQWCTGTVSYAGGTDVPVGFRVYPQDSLISFHSDLGLVPHQPWLSHLSAQLAVPVARPGSCPCGVLVAKCSKVRTGKSTRCLSDRVTGTTGVPELRGKICAFMGRR